MVYCDFVLILNTQKSMFLFRQAKPKLIRSAKSNVPLVYSCGRGVVCGGGGGGGGDAQIHRLALNSAYS